jgi:hypothetical protein
MTAKMSVRFTCDNCGEEAARGLITFPTTGPMPDPPDGWMTTIYNGPLGRSFSHACPRCSKILRHVNTKKEVT